MSYMLKFTHPFHLVTLSPWPLMTSFSILNSLIGTIQWLNEHNSILISLSGFSLIINIFQWWRDITRESTYQGFHTFEVYKLMRLGMILFIISEIFFFLSFFWTFFHVSLTPNIEIGGNWPPLSIVPFNPYNIPLLNTIILLTSGMSITWSHYCILNNMKSSSSKSLFLTIILGGYFTSIQMIEYQESLFSINDSVFGSIFFLITGFHGIHVIIGTIFILLTFFRLKKSHFSSCHHFGFEASSWYWHFVDVIWLFVYIFLYWWIF
uniref:Cytochrome c oxidase subunit 3 n=1 Tax=Hypsicera sp. ZJUH_2016019 TaxID=2491161 RepID=A0A3S5HLP6_9HYME|nr:cytochrome c oxidase subunit 3 [Hypsicera sp. ZJUH_2016019]